MSDGKFDLSRRKILAGLGTIGVAGAGAGAGTTALFSDEETFDNNQVTAGTLNLAVDYVFSGEIGQESSQTISNGTLDGGGSDNVATDTFDVSDVKPGDKGTITFDLDLTGNPAYIWMFGDITADNDNSSPEPEPDNDGSGGELDEKTDVTIRDTDPSSTVLTQGSFNEVFDRTASNPGLGVYGLPLDADNSGYDVSQRAVGAALTGPTSFTQPGVNAFTEFESGKALNATVESAQDGGGTVAHAVSDGATKDYVTTVVDLSGASVTLGSNISYQYREGANNGQAAPDEVYLEVVDNSGNTRVVYQTFNDGDGTENNYVTRDVGGEIEGSSGSTSTGEAGSARNWIEITSSGTSSIGSDLTAASDFSSNNSINAIGIGRGNTSNARQLDVYYRDLSAGGTSYPIPTADRQYTDSNRQAFSTSSGSGYTTTIEMEISVPASVGNVIQSDSLTFDVGFYAVQDRNNSGSTSA